MARTKGEIEVAATRIIDALDRRTPEQRAEADEADIPASARAAASRLRDAIGVVPWQWVTEQWIDMVEQAIEAVLDPVESFLEEPDGTPFPLSWEEVSALWAASTPLVVAIPGRAGEDPARELTQFQAAQTRAAQVLQEELMLRRQSLAELQSEIEKVAEAKDSAFAELRENQVALQSAISDQESRLDAAIRENQAQFSAAQEENRSAFASLTADHTRQLAETIGRMTSEFEDERRAFQSTASQSLDDLEKLRTKATAAFDAISEAGVAKHFQREANRQRDEANKWRAVGAWTLVIAIGVALADLLLRDSTPSVEHTLAKLPVVLAAGALAAYALRQSSQHREQERTLRQREIDVASIAPYLANIGDSEETMRLRVDHARHIFIDRSGDHGGDLPDGDIGV